MGCILIGLLLAIVFFASIMRLKLDVTGEVLMVSLISCSLVAGIFLGIFVPVSGYEEKELESSVQLININDSAISAGGELLYASVTGRNSYTFYTKVESEYVGTSMAYKIMTISGSNITVIEDDNCKTAKFEKYVAKGKKTFLTFAVGCEKTEYVFHVPTGTILRNVSLG